MCTIFEAACGYIKYLDRRQYNFFNFLGVTNTVAHVTEIMAVKALTIMKKEYDQGSNPGAVVVFPTKKVQMELHAMTSV